jgi:hypothetical protein
MMSALGFAALAVLFVGIDPFLSVGAGLSNKTPAISVNRSLKGDRLPLSSRTVLDMPDRQAKFGAQPNAEQPRAQIPFACDAAVSLIRSPHSAPASADVYRRCMA